MTMAKRTTKKTAGGSKKRTTKKTAGGSPAPEAQSEAEAPAPKAPAPSAASNNYSVAIEHIGIAMEAMERERSGGGAYISRRACRELKKLKRSMEAVAAKKDV